MKAIFKYHLLIVATLAGVLYTAGCSKAGEEAPEQAPLWATLDGTPNFKWNSQGRFLTINATADWTVTFSYPEGAPSGWCTASPSSGAGKKNVWIGITTNNTADVREATVVVTTATGNVSIDIIQYSTDDAPPATLKNRLELPKIEDTEWLFEYAVGDFVIEWSPTKKHSKWVAWPLHHGHLGSSGRTDAWQWDARIPKEYCPLREDFTSTIYNNRGHLCPSADRTQSREVNAQTFMYSNMSPQMGDFNGGIWGTLENKVRTWAGGLDTLYICAGGTIRNDNETITYTTPSQMPVPKYYFKVILRKKAGTGAYDAIGFWFEHRKYDSKTEPLSSAQVKTIDQIEALTGFDFFYNLQADIQTQVEASFNPSAWGL
jgi:endonuclease G